MGNEYYVRIQGNTFCFVVNGIHEISKLTDYPIIQDDHDKFFILQREGKQFRPKAIPTGNTLFDYIEEYTPEPLPPGPPTEMELLQEEVMLQAENQIDLDFRVTSLELGL